MALNLSALQKDLHVVTPPDPMERRKSLADLQRVEQAGQLQQMQISEAERQAALRPLIEKAITDAIDPATGDIDYKKAAAAIMPHDQEIGQNFMTFAGQQQQTEINRGLQTRKAQLENVDILEATPAPEITATAPTATGMAYPGQLGPGPTMGGGTQQVPAPIPEQEISGIPALGVAPTKVRPTSPQQKINMMREEERRKLQLAQEFRPDRFASSPQGIFDTGTGKVTAPYTTPASQGSFEAQTAQSWLARPENRGKTLADYADFQNQEKVRIAAENRVDPEQIVQYEEGGVQKYGIANKRTHQIEELKTPTGATANAPQTADQRNKKAGRELVKRSIDSIKSIGDGIITKVGPAQRADAIKRGVEAVFGNDPQFRTYQDARMALAGNLAVAQQGSRPSDADIKAIWLPLIPNPYSDTKESSDLKWGLINTMSNTNEPKQQGGGGGGSSEAIRKRLGLPPKGQ